MQLKVLTIVQGGMEPMLSARVPIWRLILLATLQLCVKVILQISLLFLVNFRSQLRMNIDILKLVGGI